LYPFKSAWSSVAKGAEHFRSFHGNLIGGIWEIFQVGNLNGIYLWGLI